MKPLGVVPADETVSVVPADETISVVPAEAIEEVCVGATVKFKLLSKCMRHRFSKYQVSVENSTLFVHILIQNYGHSLTKVVSHSRCLKISVWESAGFTV